MCVILLLAPSFDSSTARRGSTSIDGKAAFTSSISNPWPFRRMICLLDSSPYGCWLTMDVRAEWMVETRSIGGSEGRVCWRFSD